MTYMSDIRETGLSKLGGDTLLSKNARHEEILREPGSAFRLESAFDRKERKLRRGEPDSEALGEKSAPYTGDLAFLRAEICRTQPNASHCSEARKISTRVIGPLLLKTNWLH